MPATTSSGFRDLVFAELASADVRIDATILDKTKKQDRRPADPLRFYEGAWFLNFKY